MMMIAFYWDRKKCNNSKEKMVGVVEGKKKLSIGLQEKKKEPERKLKNILSREYSFIKTKNV